MVLLLEIARGVAALWVFFFHAKAIFEFSSPIIYQLSAHGSLGVPMFFVISGYVISYSAKAGLKIRKSPWLFLRSRFLRIYPTFWVSVVVILMLPYVIEIISSLKSGVYIIPDSLFAKYGYIEWAHFLLLTKVFLSTSGDLQAEFNAINSVYWTLAIEFQFYLVIFMALFFGRFYNYIICLVSLFSIILMVFPVGINNGFFIYYWPSFLVGIVLAHMHINGFWAGVLIKNSLAKFAATIFVSAALIYSIVNHQLREFFPVFFGVFLWVNSYFEPLLNKVNNGNNKLYFWLLEPWLILGTMSYSVYLLHGKLYQLPNMFVRQVMDPGNVFFGLLTITGTLLLCYPFYIFIERRFLSNSYKKLHQDTGSHSIT